MPALAPIEAAIALTSIEGPVMSDVPESTMASVGPVEKDPTFAPSKLILQ